MVGDMRIRETTIINFYTSESSVQSIVSFLNGRKTGINGQSISITTEILPPHPQRTEWEKAFSMNDSSLFTELSVGHRPDTVMLSNLPEKWFSGSDIMNNLKSFFTSFGKIK